MKRSNFPRTPLSLPVICWVVLSLVLCEASVTCRDFVEIAQTFWIPSCVSMLPLSAVVHSTWLQLNIGSFTGILVLDQSKLSMPVNSWFLCASHTFGGNNTRHHSAILWSALWKNKMCEIYVIDFLCNQFLCSSKEMWFCTWYNHVIWNMMYENGG